MLDLYPTRPGIQIFWDSFCSWGLYQKSLSIHSVKNRAESANVDTRCLSLYLQHYMIMLFRVLFIYLLVWVTLCFQSSLAHSYRFSIALIFSSPIERFCGPSSGITLKGNMVFIKFVGTSIAPPGSGWPGSR